MSFHIDISAVNEWAEVVKVMAVPLSLEPVQPDDLVRKVIADINLVLRYKGNNNPTLRINDFDKKVKTVFFWVNKEVYFKKKKKKAQQSSS